MTNPPPASANDTAAAKADALRVLHAPDRMLVLPNVWDAASARAFEAAGFAAIATTSGGVAAALGYPDHEGAPAEEMLAAAGRIVAAVAIPVSVDFEAGYQMAPHEIVERLIGVGAAGLNIEDSDHHGTAKLMDAERHADRLVALKSAAQSSGADLFLNARVDVFIQREGTASEQLAEGLRRARLYRDAGADCIYPITLSDEAMLSEFVAAVGAVNVNLRRGGPLSLQRASALGIRRVTYATSIFREAMTFVERIAGEMRSEAEPSASAPSY